MSTVKRTIYLILNRVFARRGLVLVKAAALAQPPDLPASYFEEKPYEGLIDYNGEKALALLREVFITYADEYNALPRTDTGDRSRFHLDNEFFASVDAEVLYCMVRHFKPRRVVEVGSGYSSLLTRLALDRNGSESRLICIDPAPQAEVTGAADEVLLKRIERVGLEPFDDLEQNDVLFVDSSHILRTGGDLDHIFFKVMPRLKSGVLVHFHDIFLPKDYFADWVMIKNWGFTEQYLLLAFLMGNSDYEVVWPAQYMILNYPDDILSAFPSCNQETAPGSFWIRKL
ncbi:MAG TPA: class I SAM-dependent methyltransferase [Candidatus Anoxymicrobiaceae bacterium]